MNNPISEKLRHWSLNRVQYLLAHIEGFVDDEDRDLSEQAKLFTSQTGLDKVQSLTEGLPNEEHLPARVLERLAPFFEAGLLIQRATSPDKENWWLTDIFWRGITFHLELNDQVKANNLVKEVNPL